MAVPQGMFRDEVCQLSRGEPPHSLKIVGVFGLSRGAGWRDREAATTKCRWSTYRDPGGAPLPLAMSLPAAQIVRVSGVAGWHDIDLPAI